MDSTSNSWTRIPDNVTMTTVEPVPPRFTHIALVKVIVLSTMFLVALSANSAGQFKVERSSPKVMRSWAIRPNYGFRRGPGCLEMDIFGVRQQYHQFKDERSFPKVMRSWTIKPNNGFLGGPGCLEIDLFRCPPAPTNSRSKNHFSRS